MLSDQKDVFFVLIDCHVFAKCFILQFEQGCDLPHDNVFVIFDFFDFYRFNYDLSVGLVSFFCFEIHAVGLLRHDLRRLVDYVIFLEFFDVSCKVLAVGLLVVSGSLSG